LEEEKRKIINKEMCEMRKFIIKIKDNNVKRN
jgi:hypothetical protein